MTRLETDYIHNLPTKTHICSFKSAQHAKWQYIGQNEVYFHAYHIIYHLQSAHNAPMCLDTITVNQLRDRDLLLFNTPHHLSTYMSSPYYKLTPRFNRQPKLSYKSLDMSIFVSVARASNPNLMCLRRQPQIQL